MGTSLEKGRKKILEFEATNRTKKGARCQPASDPRGRGTEKREQKKKGTKSLGAKKKSLCQVGTKGSEKNWKTATYKPAG